MAKPLVMLGAGGHASVLAELLLTENRQIIAVVSPEPIKANSPLTGLKCIANDNKLLTSYSPEQVELVNGIGSIPGSNLRLKLFNYFSEKGYRFASVLSPQANISKYINLAEGVQVMKGALIQTNVSIGKNTIINTGVIVDHDCKIGCHNHIAPGAVLCGGVITAQQVHIGTGANVTQGISIGENAVVGAGVSIVRNVITNQIIIPAPNRVAN